MPRIICINGSPRRAGNCAKLLVNAMKGAEEAGAGTVRYDLVGMRYFGCISCYACKELGGRSFGRCAVKDSLTGLLDEILEADGLIISMPVYFGDVPGMVRSLLERLWFPGYTYSKDGSGAYKKRVPSLLLYTMNVPDTAYYNSLYNQHADTFGRIVGPSRHFAVPDTLQFPDYSAYASEVFDAAAKQKRHNEEFPRECRKAHALGKELAEGWDG